MMIINGVEIPRDVESRGPKAIEAYVAEKTKTTKERA